MRILILFISFLYASEVVIKSTQKENNNTIIKEEIVLKKWLIDKYNSFVPNFLKTEPIENMFDLQIGYDIKNKRVISHLKAKLILPSIERNLQYQNKTQITTKSIKIKLIPFIQLYKSTPTLTIKPSLTYKNETLYNKFTFNESIYYYTTFTEYKEITTITLEKFINIENLIFKASKTFDSTDKANLFYLFGIYYVSEFYKFIKLYGYEVSGERKKIPFIYSHKLFFTYRHTLLKKRYLYFEFTPYLYYSKEFNFKPKLFATISLNLKF